MIIEITKPTLMRILGSSLFLFVYGLAMFVLGVAVTLLGLFVIKSGAYKRPKRLFNAAIWLAKNWDELKKYW
jgi:hypothetical protein